MAEVIMSLELRRGERRPIRLASRLVVLLTGALAGYGAGVLVARVKRRADPPEVDGSTDLRTVRPA